MRILISGSSGFLGSHLIVRLQSAGHTVVRLVRSRVSAPDQIHWDPAAGVLDAVEVSGFDAVVHLAGENIMSGRWSDERKKRIRSSRVDSTALLAERLSKAPQPPGVLVCASAAGIYGNRGDELLDERSAPGQGFLAEVCQAWERATEPLQKAGVRVVLARFAVVVHPDGGALKLMLPAFRVGLGGAIGDGRQYMSWIALGDALSALEFAISNGSVSGPVNVTSPEPVTNQTFTETLGRVLHRPTFLFLPSAAARFLLGEAADETLLSSERVIPGQLQQLGFTFQHPSLEPALRELLGRV